MLAVNFVPHELAKLELESHGGACSLKGVPFASERHLAGKLAGAAAK